MSNQPTSSAEAAMAWLKSAVLAWPRGGKKLFASELGLKPANFSHLLSKGSFDAKTFRVLATIDKLRSERFDDEVFPVQGHIVIDGIVWERRVTHTGQVFLTWKLEEPEEADDDLNNVADTD